MQQAAWRAPHDGSDAPNVSWWVAIAAACRRWRDRNRCLVSGADKPARANGGRGPPAGRLVPSGGGCTPTLIKKSGAKRPRGRLVLDCPRFFQSGAGALTALRPSRAAALWRPAPLAAALHPVTTVGRGPGGAKESLGVEGHCRSLGREPGRRARFGCRPDPGAHACSGLHLRTSGPSQPRDDRPAAHGTAPVRALTALLATRSPLQANPDRPRLLARQGHTTACPPCTAAVPS